VAVPPPAEPVTLAQDANGIFVRPAPAGTEERLRAVAPEEGDRIGDRLRRQDAAFRLVTRAFAFLVLVLLAGILISLASGSWLSITRFGAGFLFSSEWNPVTEQFGALVPIIGTLVTSAIALLIGVPVSFGIALFLTELSPVWLRRPIGTAIELLGLFLFLIF
jgi:phosphate transport system permease protein